MVMNASTNTATVEFVTPPRPETLQVMVLYEDFATGLRAKSILDRLMLRFDSAAEWRSDWFRLDLLRQPRLAIETLCKVAAADIVMVSVHGTGREYREFEAWLEVWMHRRGNRSGALVVSLDADAQHSVDGQKTLLRFRVLAAKTGMVLFPHFGGLPGGRTNGPDAAPRERGCCAVKLGFEAGPRPD